MKKKVRVALDWTLDLLLFKDLLQFLDFNQHAAMPKLQPESEQMLARKECAA